MKRKISILILFIFLLGIMTVPAMADEMELNYKEISSGNYSEIYVPEGTLAYTEEGSTVNLIDADIYIAPNAAFSIGGTLEGTVKSLEIGNEGILFVGEPGEVILTFPEDYVEEAYTRLKDVCGSAHYLEKRGNTIVILSCGRDPLAFYSSGTLWNANGTAEGSGSGSIIAGGNIWIILAVLVLATGSIAVLIVRKQKEKAKAVDHR